jgi:hypothetical protein
MNVKDDTYTQTPASVYPSLVDDEDVSLQEVSHVFHCMQCDFEFQMDMAITSSNGSPEKDAWIVHVRLDPHLKLERETLLQKAVTK